MNYEFPLIENISDVLPAIAGRDEFIVAEREGYKVLNYLVNFEDTFPPIKVTGGSAKMRAERALHNALRRECRGIIFCSETGVILRRPFHKFFNVNEREETQDHVINLSNEHAVLEKLDGSMIAPFFVGNRLIWGTKMGDTEVAQPVHEFVENNARYIDFAKQCIEDGFTPIFEWCSRKQRIVLDHPEDQLILTAIRNMKTGVYTKQMWLEGWEKHWNIPVVRAFDPQSDMKEFIEYVRGLENIEGFVTRFSDGHMVKLKCDWYVQIHKAKDSLLHDRNIVDMWLNNTIDDVKAHLDQNDRDRLDQFTASLESWINARVKMIYNTRVATRKMSRKDFAMGHANKLDQYSKSLVFRVWDEEIDESMLAKIHTMVYDLLKSKLSNNKSYGEIRLAWFEGIKYNDN